jgi:3-isopropylmalate dehydratase small subunit
MTANARVWLFGDDVNTDMIIPGRYLDNYDPDHLASHAMEGIDPGFASRVSKGDVIVAGVNFGCGSSREQAVIALKHAGVQAVVAVSFARIFYRNSINLGLPSIVSSDASRVFNSGDSVRLDLLSNRMQSDDGSRTAALDPVPEHLAKILESGGLIPYLKSRLKS